MPPIVTPCYDSFTLYLYHIVILRFEISKILADILGIYENFVIATIDDISVLLSIYRDISGNIGHYYRSTLLKPRKCGCLGL